jgi:hypothetical protein
LLIDVAESDVRDDSADLAHRCAETLEGAADICREDFSCNSINQRQQQQQIMILDSWSQPSGQVGISLVYTCCPIMLGTCVHPHAAHFAAWQLL